MYGRIRDPAAYRAACIRNARAARGPSKVYGHGDYYGKKPKAARKAPLKKRARRNSEPSLSKMGIGARLGAAAGSILQKGFKKLTGFGDYKESGSALNMGGDVPQFANGSGSSTAQSGSIRVQHREYIQDIQGSTGFNIQSFILNPGLNDTFPWLDALAANFEQYRIRGMAFVYKATCATAVASTNTALGTVVMATQYNANAAAFQNKQQMENYQFAQSGVPFNDITHYIECAKSQTSVSNLYIRTGSVPSGQDARLYDMGIFYLATVGMQAASTIGELWVTYDIELLKPRIISGTGGNIVLSDHFILAGTPTTGINYLGTGGGPTATSNLGGVINATGAYSAGNGTGNNNWYVFPDHINQGTFMYFYQVTGAAGLLTNSLVTSLGTNLSRKLFLAGNTTGAFNQVAGVTAGTQWEIGTIAFNGGTAANQNWLRWTAGTLPGTLTSAELWVTQLNPVQLSMLESKEAEHEEKVSALVEAYLAKRGLSTYDIEAVAENLNNVDRTLGLPEVPPVQQQEEFVHVKNSLKTPQVSPREEKKTHGSHSRSVK